MKLGHHYLKLLFKIQANYPILKEWDRDIIYSDLHNTLRYKILNSIGAYLDLKVRELEDASFITDNLEYDFQKIKKIYKRFNNDTLYIISNKEKLNNINIKNAFKYLFKYRLTLNQIQNMNLEIKYAKGFDQLPMFTVATLNEKIRKEIKLIDCLLEYMLNPKNINYSKKKMRKEFTSIQLDIDNI